MRESPVLAQSFVKSEASQAQILIWRRASSLSFGFLVWLADILKLGAIHRLIGANPLTGPVCLELGPSSDPFLYLDEKWPTRKELNSCVNDITLPVPLLSDIHGKPTPVHIRVLQWQPGQCLNKASVKVGPVERVKEDLGWIPHLALKISVAGVAKCP